MIQKYSAVFLAVVLVISAVFIMPLSTAFAAQRPIVAVLPVIDNSNQRSCRFAISEIEERMVSKFSNGRYIVLSGQVLLDSLRREGIYDPRNVDNATLQAALRRMRVDYSVRGELLYVTLKQKVSFPSILLFMKTWTASVPLSVIIINVKHGGIIYDKTLAENGNHEAVIGFASQANAIRNALDKVLDRFDGEVYIP